MASNPRTWTDRYFVIYTGWSVDGHEKCISICYTNCCAQLYECNVRVCVNGSACEVEHCECIVSM